MKKTVQKDITTIIDETKKIIKIAKKGSQSLNGDNIYANKFILKHSEAKKDISNLANISNSKTTGKILKKISAEVEKFFDVNSSDNERRKISQKINKLYKIGFELEIKKTKNVSVSNDLFPLELLHNTKGYLEKIGIQAAGSYDNEWYDASAVMIRRLAETLIIECFEAHKISEKIKNHDGDFLYLEGLIIKLNEENGGSWNLSRNCKKSLTAFKKIGDQSAHSRYFTAKKPDIDKIKNDLRIVIEELLIISKLTN